MDPFLAGVLVTIFSFALGKFASERIK